MPHYFDVNSLRRTNFGDLGHRLCGRGFLFATTQSKHLQHARAKLEESNIDMKVAALEPGITGSQVNYWSFSHLTHLLIEENVDDRVVDC